MIDTRQIVTLYETAAEYFILVPEFSFNAAGKRYNAGKRVSPITVTSKAECYYKLKRRKESLF